MADHDTRTEGGGGPGDQPAAAVVGDGDVEALFDYFMVKDNSRGDEQVYLCACPCFVLQTLRMNVNASMFCRSSLCVSHLICKSDV